MSDKQKTIRKCKDIRDRVYDRNMLPGCRFKKEVMKLLSPSSVVLDVGCGRSAAFLRSLAPYVRVAYGIDLEVGEPIRDGNMEVMHGDAEAMPFEDHGIDVVTMVDVAEHLPNPGSVFRECRRVLKPGGSFVILTPCKFHPPIFFGRAVPDRIRKWANFRITGTRQDDTFPAYYRVNSSAALRRLASTTGFHVVNIECLSNHPQYLMFSVFAYRIGVALERHLLQRGLFSPFRQEILCELTSSET